MKHSVSEKLVMVNENKTSVETTENSCYRHAELIAVEVSDEIE